MGIAQRPDRVFDAWTELCSRLHIAVRNLTWNMLESKTQNFIQHYGIIQARIDRMTDQTKARSFTAVHLSLYLSVSIENRMCEGLLDVHRIHQWDKCLYRNVVTTVRAVCCVLEIDALFQVKDDSLSDGSRGMCSHSSRCVTCICHN